MKCSVDIRNGKGKSSVMKCSSDQLDAGLCIAPFQTCIVKKESAICEAEAPSLGGRKVCLKMLRLVRI